MTPPIIEKNRVLGGCGGQSKDGHQFAPREPQRAALGSVAPKTCHTQANRQSPKHRECDSPSCFERNQISCEWVFLFSPGVSCTWPVAVLIMRPQGPLVSRLTIRTGSFPLRVTPLAKVLEEVEVVRTAFPPVRSGRYERPTASDGERHRLELCNAPPMHRRRRF